MHWPTGMAIAGFCLVSCMCALGSWHNTRLTLAEIRSVKADQLDVRSGVEAFVKLELQGVVSAIKAEQSRLLDDIRNAKLEIERSRADVKSSIDRAHVALADSVTSDLSKTNNAIASKMSQLASSSEASSLSLQMTRLHDRLDKLEKPIENSAKAPSGASAATAQSERHLPPPVAHVNPPTPPLPDGSHVHESGPQQSDYVNILVQYRQGALPGHDALLYWLGHNETEHLYSTIPAKMQVNELSRPGECWRIRDATTGNDLVERYCATSEENQVLTITDAQEVALDFHLPPASHSTHGALESASAVEIFELLSPELPDEPESTLEGSGERRVGTIYHGSHMSVKTQAGTRFHAYERHSRRLIAAVTASVEQKQYITIGHGEDVALEFASPRGSKQQLAIFHVRDDGEQHLHANLDAGTALRVRTVAGEQWAVRLRATDALVVALTASSEAFQRVDIPHSESIAPKSFIFGKKRR